MFGTRTAWIVSLLFVSSTAMAQTSPKAVEESLFSFHTRKTQRLNFTSAGNCPTLKLPDGTYPMVVEDTLEIYSFRTRANDGQVVQTTTNHIGSGLQCFGVVGALPGNHVRVLMVGVWQFGDVTVRGTGYCDGRRNIPIASTDPANPTGGTTLYTCYADLTGDGLTTPVGGHLVGTATAITDAAPAEFDPDVFGTHQSTFVNLRLWVPVN